MITIDLGSKNGLRFKFYQVRLEHSDTKIYPNEFFLDWKISMKLSILPVLIGDKQSEGIPWYI